jgi:formylglycine-generating enzyme required for sulfatase activity/serine/threonine protein kinase
MKRCSKCQAIYPDSATFCSVDGATLVSATGLEPGVTIRRKYRIDAEIGRGGMGVVYKAWHMVFRQPRALKVISAQYASDPQFVERFLIEAMVTHEIQHPNIVRVEDTDETEDGCPFVAMEFVEGRSLRKLLADEGPVEPSRALYFASQVCAGLTAAHARGIIHRDIKPDNILIAEVQDTEVIKVLDFGIAKLKHGFGLSMAGAATTGSMFLGTPQYASPEQARGGGQAELDQRSDIYSLGVVLYEVLTGQLPFTGASPLDLLMAHVQERPANPREVWPELDLPEAAVAVVMKALEKDRGARYATAEEMRLAMERASHALRRRRQQQLPPTVVRPAAAPQPAPAVTSSVLEYIEAAQRELAAGHFTAAAAWVDKARAFDERHGEVLALEREIGERRAKWLRDNRIAELTELVRRAATSDEREQARELLAQARREFGDDPRLSELDGELAEQERAVAEAEARRQAEERQRAEAQRRAQAEREAEARRVAEAEAQRRAGAEGQAEAQRRAQAERKAEAEARRQSEERQRTEAERRTRLPTALEVAAIAKAQQLTDPERRAQAPTETPLPPTRQPVAPSHTPESRRRRRRSLGVVGLIVLVSAAIAWFLFPRPSPPVPPPSPPDFQVGPGQSTAPDAGAAPQGKAATQTDPGGLTYLWIPPGTFEMGCSPEDSDCRNDEKPAHRVTITKGFWMGSTEVTVAAYKRFTAATGRAMPAEPGFNSSWRLGEHPVVNETWDDAAAYCRWAGGRLPTEAEWEYAARAGTTGVRRGDLNAVAWYDGNSGGETHPVGQKAANAFGLYDMLGNAWEWVADWYAVEYYASSPASDPTGPSSGSLRVLRGGSWFYDARIIRVSFRGAYLPRDRYDDHGFRCVREVIP